METITMPVKGFVEMRSPYSCGGPSKVRFFVRLSDVPNSLTNWMSTNPREQNLNSMVAQAILSSIRHGSMDFHLKNRGILFSAKTAVFSPQGEGSSDGEVSLTFEQQNLHGNVDGGHTLRLILASQRESGLPEQYVEFEVILGLDDLIPIAEARNTSVALDVRTMEEMKGNFDILKAVFGDMEVCGDRFFDRVELKMNQQFKEANHIDIRTLISIILMFNQELYPVPHNKMPGAKDAPTQMYGNPETALKKYLELGGSVERRNESIRKMFPILKDIVVLWDTIEREFPLVDEKKYAVLPFSHRLKAPKAMFSNRLMEYTVPKSVMFPIVAGFRVLVDMNEQGDYRWKEQPLEIWDRTKKSIAKTFMNTMKTTKNNPNMVAKKSIFWRQFNQIVLLALYQDVLP